MSKVESAVHAYPSEVYPAGKLQCHFTCGLPFETIFAVLKGLNLV